MKNHAHAAMTHSGAIVYLPDHFDLMADYKRPRKWTARRPGGKICSVRIDHDATGTGTTGTGDTVVRVV